MKNTIIGSSFIRRRPINTLLNLYSPSDHIQTHPIFLCIIPFIHDNFISSFRIHNFSCVHRFLDAI